MAFYGFLYLLVAFASPPEWGRAFHALAGVYGLAFFALVAGYFWARWYAIGVAMSGLISAVISVFQVGTEPVLMFYGLTHGAVALILWGNAMAKGFDGQASWREKFHMDEHATNRLGKAVIRVGISLPYILLYALAPKEGQGLELAALLGLGLATAGFAAIVRLRTWGILALGGAAGMMGVASLSANTSVPAYGLAAPVAAFALALAVAPFVGPMLKQLRDAR